MADRKASDIDFDVLITGPLLNNDIVMAEALTYRGFRCLVVRDAAVGRPNPERLPSRLKHFSLDRVILCDTSREVLRLCRKSRCIITYSGNLTSLLRYYWLFAAFFTLPPIVNVPTGSDITELALARSRAGWLYRSLLMHCAFTVISPYVHAIRALQALKLERYMFMRYPYLLSKEVHSIDTCLIGDEIVYLHVSHLDWGVTDRKPGRNSTKGNDRFIRAFVEQARAGYPIRCKIIDRGPDRLIARKMIEELGASRFFEWLPAVLPSELPQLMVSADVVVDQFDVGGFGGIALEAMAIGKPVMTYLDPSCASLIYDGTVPIINCFTEEHIRDAIRTNLDRSALRELGERAKRWVFANHGTEHNMEEFVLRLCVVAGLEWPRLSR
jgi:glycosyltransferase involved in cell wall biosynthesis